MIINLFFFFLYTFISKLNCLYNNEITNATLNMKKKLDSNNYITLNFNDEIKKPYQLEKFMKRHFLIQKNIYLILIN